jgi:hypothetical protein
MNEQHARLLATVRRKLDIERECARAALARLRGQERSGADGLQELRATCAAHEAHAATQVRDRLDATGHAQALKHLVHLRGDLARREEDARRLRDRITQAAAHCVVQDRKLASVRELQESIERRRAADRQRRAATECDRAWLARWTKSLPTVDLRGVRE